MPEREPCPCGKPHSAKGLCAQCYQREYRKANQEKARDYLREWQRAHPDRVRLYKQRWKENHPETYRAGFQRYNRRWHFEHYGEERYVARKRNWIIANREKTRVYGLKRYHRVRAACGEWTEAEIDAIYAKQRGRCNPGDGCGKKFPRNKLAIEHRYPVSRGGCNYAFNLQLLCFSCNSRKYNKITTAEVSLFDRASV